MPEKKKRVWVGYCDSTEPFKWTLCKKYFLRNTHWIEKAKYSGAKKIRITVEKL